MRRFGLSTVLMLSIAVTAPPARLASLRGDALIEVRRHRRVAGVRG